jgi:hypothetical protein
MSSNAGENKRIVKKGKNTEKSLNIKVSTEDKDQIGNNNKKTLKKNQSATLKNVDQIIEEDIDVFEKTKNLEQELDNLKIEMNNTSQRAFRELEELNNKISELHQNEINLVSKKNNLMSRLKGIEQQVSEKFSSKFKISKILAKKKELEKKKDINTQIKSAEKQQKTAQKNIKYYEKEIQKLEALLEENKDGKEEELNTKLTDFNKSINENLNRIKELNKMKKNHQFCDNAITNLNIKLNELKNEIEFQKKLLNMKESKDKKEADNIVQRESSPNEPIIIKNKVDVNSNYGKKVIFSEKIRDKSLKKANNKYSSKQMINRYKYYNYLTNELDDKSMIDNKINIKNRNSLDNNINQTNRNQVKTMANAEQNSFSAYMKKEVPAKIKITKPKNYLISEKENKYISKLLPEDYVKKVTKKYGEIENQIKEIEGGKKKENKQLKSALDEDKIQIERLNVKNKEEEMKKIKNNDIFTKNKKKILDLKKQISELNENINKEKAMIKKKDKNIEYLSKKIEELKNMKNKKENEEDEENEEEEGANEEKIE